LSRKESRPSLSWFNITAFKGWSGILDSLTSLPTCQLLTSDIADGYDDPLGLLQLADFGTGSIHRAISKSNIPRNAVQHTYRPPEIDLLQPLSRSMDIWSLGCVFLEFVSWLVKGWKPGEFASKRMTPGLNASNMEQDTFFEIKQPGKKTIVQVNEGVVQVSLATPHNSVYI
jgi:serine/threonine protein kinase